MTACGSDDDDSKDSKSDKKKGATLPCETVPAATVARLEDQLRAANGQLTFVRAVRSKATFKRNLKNPYFIAGFTDSKGKADVGTWATASLRNPRTFIPVDGVAVSASKPAKGSTATSYGIKGNVEGFGEARNSARICAAQANKRSKKPAKKKGKQQPKKPANEKKPTGTGTTGTGTTGTGTGGDATAPTTTAP